VDFQLQGRTNNPRGFGAKVMQQHLQASFLVFFVFSSLALLTTSHLVGLRNLGETCYANVLFQLLYRNTDFRSSLQNYLLNKSTNHDTSTMAALQEIFSQMDQATFKSAITPNTFEALPADFVPNTQYDVFEVLERYQKTPNFDWSPFAIELQDKTNENEKITKLELLLKIPQQANTPHTLRAMLNNFFSQSQTSISKLPNNLLIRINRLRCVNGFDTKICKTIEIPEMLSLQRFCCCKNKQTLLLDAFIEHCGNCTNDGHYIIYFRNEHNNSFWSISDDKIQEVSHERFLEKASTAYIYLFKSIE
jgi:ubiquitin C-terminal hydrolase